MENTLSNQQQAIIPIAAFAATGDLESLNRALNQGLDDGLTINEIKAVLVQTYAYAGFPRSLNALAEFMRVIEQRKSQGSDDQEGKDSQPLAQDYNARVQGEQNQTQLVGQPVTGALFEFSPEIDEYLKTHLFGDIFSRDVLSWQDREIATVSMLAAMTGTESQLKSHVNMSLNIQVSVQQLNQIQQILAEKVSLDASQKLQKILNP
ncbi:MULTISPECIES: carboxymuconolactone decarboxylase family protein [Acinetobacter]|uniref:carboxymuconolactone decarboxylase family protein n=1 Tax=Acinetobacter TaxID=469 RepID=UPI000C62DCB6|nr:4-carboxymuconolactone decarboxylase [Acinetobacter sp.]MEC8567482.1 carboxymuconolactone decarboxylase family protein [Pseudomonadota bacterium]HIQ34752.1 4-carboxymuconolactone decarboxylase [Acinetobacter venetianus]MBT48510.1 4-carboxymuconolactone decarboxylase [Acinetobacter sp.]MBT51058.1 4-carboxymuconolactone decarboxylase [Acinetobacter sp.]